MTLEDRIIKLEKEIEPLVLEYRRELVRLKANNKALEAKVKALGDRSLRRDVDLGHLTVIN